VAKNDIILVDLDNCIRVNRYRLEDILRTTLAKLSLNMRLDSVIVIAMEIAINEAVTKFIEQQDGK
jgi:hypothetical protein